MKLALLILTFALSATTWSGQKPDLEKISEIGKIIHSEVSGLKTHKGWMSTTKLMEEVEVFDSMTNRIMAVFCGEEANKSVLIVGEPSDTFKYLFARFAKMATPAGCDRLSHVEITTSKLQGHMYVGTTERAWRDHIEEPAYDKDVVVYIQNLAHLIGIGTHSNQDTGIESTYTQDFKTGKLKTIAFLNKYDYQRLSQSRHSYVINSFEEIIQINEISMKAVDILARKFIEINAPRLTISERVAKYLYRNVGYYQPNVLEPQRTMSIIQALIRTHNRKTNLSFKHVRDAIMKIVQVPAWIVKRDYTLVKQLKGKLDGDVVGVKQGKKDVIKQFKVGYVSGRTDEKPAGSIMLVGPTGTGKSYIAKKAAEFMKMKLITFDMTQYSTIGSFDRFLDAVSKSLILYPYAVYLFEEIDKANTKVLDRLYFMMDEGIFYDKSQRPLFARGSMVMMTTNAGHDLIVREKDNPNLKRLVNKELQKFYRPSFLNRFDAISIVTPFSDAEFHQLAKIMVSKKIQQMKEFFEWTVSVSKEALFYMGKNGRSDLYGARPMERLVDNVISVGVSEYQIEVGNIDFGDKVNISKVKDKKDRFTIQVNGKESIEFVVDADNNNGEGSFRSVAPKARQGRMVKKLFKVHPAYR